MDGRATLICALLLLAHTATGAVITVQSNSTSDFLVGGNISLSITYTSTGDTFVSWSKDDFVLVKWEENIIKPSPAYKDRLTIIGNGSLVIKSSTKADSGNYTVSVESFTEAAGTLMFPVRIYDPVINPSVAQSPAAADESTPVVNLTCSAASGGETYTWAREGASLPSNGSYVTLDGGRTLQINTPNRMHNGNYSCNVSNPVAWEITTWPLNITFSDKSQSPSLGAVTGFVIAAMCGVIFLTEELWS